MSENRITFDILPAGATGRSATIKIGTVQQIEENEILKIENVGDENDAIFNFLIPRGKKGEKGDIGPRGERGEQGEQGLKGDTGERGAQGVPGESYDDTKITKKIDEIVKKFDNSLYNKKDIQNRMIKITDNELYKNISVEIVGEPKIEIIKNILPNNLENRIEKNGLEYDKRKDGTIWVRGTATARTEERVYFWDSDNEEFYLEAGTNYINNGNMTLYLSGVKKYHILGVGQIYTPTERDKINNAFFRVEVGTKIDKEVKVMISKAKTEYYQPYINNDLNNKVSVVINNNIVAKLDLSAYDLSENNKIYFDTLSNKWKYNTTDITDGALILELNKINEVVLDKQENEIYLIYGGEQTPEIKIIYKQSLQARIKNLENAIVTLGGKI